MRIDNRGLDAQSRRTRHRNVFPSVAQLFS